MSKLGLTWEYHLGGFLFTVVSRFNANANTFPKVGGFPGQPHVMGPQFHCCTKSKTGFTIKSFCKMNLAIQANLPNLPEMFNFYTRHLIMSSKCPECRLESFQNEIKMLLFDKFKGFLILTKFGSKIRQIRIICLICQLSLRLSNVYT